jgi:hypothetical protein
MDTVNDFSGFTPAEVAAFTQEVRHPHSHNKLTIDIMLCSWRFFEVGENRQITLHRLLEFHACLQNC